MYGGLGKALIHQLKHPALSNYVGWVERSEAQQIQQPVFLLNP
jgi:hypothetical protein